MNFDFLKLIRNIALLAIIALGFVACSTTPGPADPPEETSADDGPWDIIS